MTEVSTSLKNAPTMRIITAGKLVPSMAIFMASDRVKSLPRRHRRIPTKPTMHKSAGNADQSKSTSPSPELIAGSWCGVGTLAFFGLAGSQSQATENNRAQYGNERGHHGCNRRNHQSSYVRSGSCATYREKHLFEASVFHTPKLSHLLNRYKPQTQELTNARIL